MAEITGQQFVEWMAFCSVEPFGQEWLQTGLIASLIANANRDPELRSEPFTPRDFMPVAEELEQDEESWIRNKQLMKMLAAGPKNGARKK